MSAGFVQMSDEVAAYCWTVVAEHAEHRPCVHIERKRALVELTAAGRIDWDPLRDKDVPAPWEVRPDLGRWP